MAEITYDYGDETVVITGASSGIGRATAMRFGAAGATVVNADLREEPKDDNAETPTHVAIEDAGGTARFVRTDVTDPAEVQAVIEAAHEFGGVDIMVNNAATHYTGSFLDVDPDELDRLLSVNVRGVLVGSQAAARDMIERDKSGVILNTASIASNHAQHDQVPYDTSKGAVRMLTRGVALELADEGIRVNAVAPGQIATEFFDGWSEQAVEMVDADELLKPVPLGRAGFPRDVAGAYLYLASDDAGYVTGELLHVDGGWQIG